MSYRKSNTLFKQIPILFVEESNIGYTLLVSREGWRFAEQILPDLDIGEPVEWVGVVWQYDRPPWLLHYTTVERNHLIRRLHIQACHDIVIGLSLVNSQLPATIFQIIHTHVPI